MTSYLDIAILILRNRRRKLDVDVCNTWDMLRLVCFGELFDVFRPSVLHLLLSSVRHSASKEVRIFGDIPQFSFRVVLRDNWHTPGFVFCEYQCLCCMLWGDRLSSFDIQRTLGRQKGNWTNVEMDNGMGSGTLAVRWILRVDRTMKMIRKQLIMLMTCDT
jgi:hypothetical protein